MSSRIHGPTDAADVTPSDTVDSTTALSSENAAEGAHAMGLLVAVGGNVRVQMVSGNAVTLPALSAGQIYPAQFTHVLATGTTATGIVALFT